MKIKQRILHQLVAMACLVLFSYVTLHAQTGKVFFNPDTTRVSPTDGFEVKIEVDNNVKVIHCYKVSVQFDTTLVHLMDVVEGPLLQLHGTTFFTWSYKQGSYDILSCLLGYGLYADGPGVLATMRFRGMGRAGTTPLIFTNVEFQDTALNYMSVNHRDGAVILSGDQAPSVQVTSPPSGGTYNSLPTLSIHFTDDRGLNRGYYQMDGCTGTWTQLWSYNSASLDTSINWTVPSVPEGLHSIYFKVTDDAGNVNLDSCTYSWSFTYDLTRPAASVISPPSGGTYNSLPTLSVHFTDDRGLNRGYYQIDGCTGTWTQLWSYNSASLDTSINWTVPSVPQGLHSIYFKVTDDAGNVNLDSCTYSWSFTYDLTRPAASVTSPPSGGTYNSLPTLSVHFTDDRGLNRGYYQIDGCTGTWTQLWSYNSASLDTSINWMVPSVPEGLHSIYFKVTDDAGNVNLDSCTYSWIFTYNASVPRIPVLLSPVDSSMTCDSTPTFVWTTSSLRFKAGAMIADGNHPALSKATSFTYTLQYSTDSFFAHTTTVESIAESTFTLPDNSALDDTTFFWRVETIDQGNNHSGYQAHPFKITVYLSGDVNYDGKLNVSDAIYLVNYLFKGGPKPHPMEAGDADRDGKVSVGDVIYLINYLFKGGARPACIS